MNYLTLEDLADRWGIPYPTLKQRRHRGKLPEPDIMLGRTPAWELDTIEKLEDRNEHVGGTRASS